jgi:general stress protein CsbA
MKINILAIIIVVIGVLLRIIPHMPNFAPVAAVALFSGVYFSKKMAIALPVILMLVSDIFIGFYEPKLMISVYASFILCGLLGFWLKNHKKWRMILGCSICSSFVFFILTNFTVFAFTPWYPKTIFGITKCYLMALPFFRNTLLGDLFYTGVFFGAYELADILAKIRLKRSAVCKSP